MRKMQNAITELPLCRNGGTALSKKLVGSVCESFLNLRLSGIENLRLHDLPRRACPAGDILKTAGVENGIYLLQFPLSPRVFSPEYPENPRTLGETIRKARIGRGLMIKKLAELLGVDGMTIINWELRNRCPKEKFHRSLKRVLDIGVELERAQSEELKTEY